jgi:hypothetical protein
VVVWQNYRSKFVWVCVQGGRVSRILDELIFRLGQEDNATLIISEHTSKSSPVNGESSLKVSSLLFQNLLRLARNLIFVLLLVDFYEMRRRNKLFEGGIYNYAYSQLFGVLIPLVERTGAGFFHCTRPLE